MDCKVTTRILDRADYARLAGTELETVAAYLPASAQVVIVEDAAGALVACWAVYPLVHVEGVWIAPAHRTKSAAARQLLQGMRQTARRMGALAVNTASVSAEVSTMLRKLGAVQLEGEHFSLRVGL